MQCISMTLLGKDIVIHAFSQKQVQWHFVLSQKQQHFCAAVVEDVKSSITSITGRRKRFSCIIYVIYTSIYYCST